MEPADGKELRKAHVRNFALSKVVFVTAVTEMTAYRGYGRPGRTFGTGTGAPRPAEPSVTVLTFTFCALACNEDDILYYRTCPRGFPAGVREFGERLWAHHEALGHQVPHRLLRYSARVSECHYVACADAADELRPVPA